MYYVHLLLKIGNRVSCIYHITDLGDHGVIIDADVTSLLDAAVDTDLTAKCFYWTVSVQMNNTRTYKKRSNK